MVTYRTLNLPSIPILRRRNALWPRHSLVLITLLLFNLDDIE